MVYVELNGRFGNYLFQIATAASLANKNKCEFAVVCHDKYLLPNNSTICDYIQQFKENILKDITILTDRPEDCHLFSQEGASFKPIPYSKNIYIHGTFQSEKYFDSSVARKLFKIPVGLLENLYQKYGHLISKGITAVHVRRGDYLTRPHEYNVASMPYFKKAINYIGRETDFLIISDDIEWCKLNFNGGNYYFADNNSAIADFYLQSLCRNNIISNSSYSWWGAWLNENPDKIVIAPKPWYGKAFASVNTEDLIPSGWVQIRNRMAFRMRISSYYIRIRIKLLPIIYSVKDKLFH